MSDDNEIALAQLHLREVRYVVTDDPERVTATSAQLLGVPAPENPLIARLARERDLPPFLEPVFANQFFRVYKVRTDCFRFCRGRRRQRRLRRGAHGGKRGTEDRGH
jgi:hypothetical protein